MRIWTISAAAGAGGERIAADLAEAAGVPLLDFKALSSLLPDELRDVPDLAHLEERVGGRLNAIGLSLAMIGTGSALALSELEFRRTLPELGRAVLGEAARSSCVILAQSAFLGLRDHVSAVHVRIHAPLEWRIDAYQRDNVIDRPAAERAVKHDDHMTRTWVKTIYHANLDDYSMFSVVLDASRLSPERVVEMLIAASI
jgi:Cytidylate kinase-like family